MAPAVGEGGMSEPENPHLVCTGPGTGPGKDDGGKCFTLRDLFAAFALAGVISRVPPDVYGPWKSLAEEAYKCANAMLAERENTT